MKAALAGPCGPTRAHPTANCSHTNSSLNFLRSRLQQPDDQDDLPTRQTTPTNTIAMAPKKGAKTADSINAKLALTIKVRICCEIPLDKKYRN